MTKLQASDPDQATILANNARLQARSNILVSILGFGLDAVTAFALLIDLPESDSMDGKQAANLAGLAPVTRQSGHWRGKKLYPRWAGNAQVGTLLPALVVIRFNPPLKAKYLALRQAGKRKSRHHAETRHHRQCVAA